MNPDQYVSIVVLPTVREFLQKRHDRRLAYLSAISSYHIVDYLMRASSPPTETARRAEMKRISNLIRIRAPDAFTVVESMCNGAKHCGRDKGTPFTPGDERETLQFGFGRKAGTGGFGKGHWGPKRLYLELDGRMYVVDAAIKAFLVATVEAFPVELDHVFPTTTLS